MTSAAVTELTGSYWNVTVRGASADASGSDFSEAFSKASMKNDAESLGTHTVRSADKRPAEKAEQVTDKAEHASQKASEKPDEAQKSEEVTESSQKSQETEKAVEDPEAAKTDNRTEEVTEEATTDEETIPMEILSTLNGQAAELIQNIAEKLGVSTEDVMNAMQTLGLEMTDVLNADNMIPITVEITGEDMVSLVTDETLYQSTQELTQMVSEAGEQLRSELGISEEELKMLLEKAGNQSSMTEEAPLEMTNEKPFVTQQKEMQGTQKVLDGAQQEQEMNGHKAVMSDQELNQTQKEMGKETGNAVTQQQMQETLETESATPGNHRESGTDDTDMGKSHNGAEGQNFADTLRAGADHFLEAITQESARPQTSQFSENLMKQITEFMKLQTRGELSEVELQLHPASLGTLNISVASKSGVITAQFTAQNEAVKEVLESQIVQLRENLENQGVKVEAVEVAVASHEFERNLDQNAEQEAKQAAEAEAKRKNIRRIDVNAELAEEEMLDEADLITKDMMVKHGNSIDYTA